ncbi:MAG: septation protein A, partial [Alphaproteobacteria bacterium]
PGPKTRYLIVMKHLLKLAIEAGPLVIFIIVNARSDLFTGTAAFMVATVVALAAGWILQRRLPVMPLVSGAFILVFGGLTLYLADELFIKLKPTVVNLLFALILGGGLAMGRPLLQLAFGSAFQLTPDGWRILTLRWTGFFVVMAILNEYVWRNFATDFWINYKLFGALPLTVVFALIQTPLLLRHQITAESADESAD